MSNHHRFRLSHLMPNSWFYKLRDMKRPRPPRHRRTTSTTRNPNSKRSSSQYYHGTTTPKPLPLSPHQSYSCYLQTQQLHLSPLHVNPNATDIQFPRDHRRCSPSTPRSAAIAVVVDDDEEFQDLLQLRPIRTRPASSSWTEQRNGTSCPSSPRLRSRRLHGLGAGGCRAGGSATPTSTGRRRSAARRSFAVAKASTDPSRDFRESMVEMIVENDIRAAEDMEDLLECYLSLNSRVYHGVIMEVFGRIRIEISDKWQH